MNRRLDLGTVGRKGLLEKDLVLDIVERLGKLVEEKLNAEVIYTRRDDCYLHLEKRHDKRTCSFPAVCVLVFRTPGLPLRIAFVLLSDVAFAIRSFGDSVQSEVFPAK